MRWQLLNASPDEYLAWGEVLGIDMASAASPAGSEMETCDGVLVIDDGSQDASDSLDVALAMRECRPELRVAVLSLIDRDVSDAEAHSRLTNNQTVISNPYTGSLPPPFQQPVNSTSVQQELEISVSQDVISFEYQGCRNI